eukprot:4355984-Prymnesium_polylepis.1
MHSPAKGFRHHGMCRGMYSPATGSDMWMCCRGVYSGSGTISVLLREHEPKRRCVPPPASLTAGRAEDHTVHLRAALTRCPTCSRCRGRVGSGSGGPSCWGVQ